VPKLVIDDRRDLAPAEDSAEGKRAVQRSTRQRTAQADNIRLGDEEIRVETDYVFCGRSAPRRSAICSTRLQSSGASARDRLTPITSVWAFLTRENTLRAMTTTPPRAPTRSRQ
jgi:hypothetical protein